MSQFPSLKELLTIMIRPREVIRNVVQSDSKKYFILIAFLLGFLGAMDIAAMGDLGAQYDVLSIIIGCLIVGLPYGYAILSLFSVVIFWVSKLFKGRAGYYQTRAAVSWAFAPRALNILIWGVNIALVGAAAFHLEDPVALVGPVFYTYQVTTFLMALIVVWTWITSLQTLSEVNGYSSWISLAVVVLSTFVIVGFWILISMLITFFQ